MGVKIGAVDRIPSKDVSKQSHELYKFKYSKSEGLGYAVLEAQSMVEGIVQTQMIVIPVGQLSAKQKREREKNIIIDGNVTPGINSKASSTTKKKFHRMKL